MSPNLIYNKFNSTQSLSTLMLNEKKYKKITSATGFEPVRAEPKRFQVFLLNHSDKLTLATYKKM